LDVKQLMRHCKLRDVAYVKAEVANFGEKAVLEAEEKDSHCLMAAIFFGKQDCGISPFSSSQTKKKKEEKCAQEIAVLVEYLLTIGADVNEKFVDGASAISVATKNRNIPVMKVLLNYKADLEIEDFRGQTTIFHAARFYKSSTDGIADTDGSSALSLLIKKGANMDAKDKKGKTALHVAAEKGDIPVMKLLLDSSLPIKKGANINAKDNEGETALCVAAEKGDIPVMELLMDSGADIEIGDNLGETPIFHVKKQSGALSLLIKNGAKINAKNKNGQTALRVAQCKKEFEWGFDLLENGAEFKIAKDANC